MSGIPMAKNEDWGNALDGGGITGYPGRVYGPLAGSGGRGVRFEVFTDRIVARDPSGEVFTLYSNSAQVERSGAGLSIEASDRSFALVTTDRAALEELRESAPFEIREKIESAMGDLRSSQRGQRFTMLLVAVLLGLVGWFGYVGLKSAAQATVKKLPISLDREIGDLAGSEVIPGATPLADPVVPAALEEMVQRLEPTAAVEGFDYRIEVLQSPNVNAIALPGGRIFVLTGLISAAETPEQVAGVLAHEMAHVTLRHGVKRLVQSLGLVVAVEIVIGDWGGLCVLMVEGVRHMVEQGYSREAEAEADAEGVRMLLAAQIDPRGLARFFETLQHKHSTEIPTWLGSHPDLEDRIQRVEGLVEEAQVSQYQGFSFEWDEVRDRVE